MEDARKLGERNWRNAARNRDSWQKLLKKALAQKGLLCCANDDDYYYYDADDDDDHDGADWLSRNVGRRCTISQRSEDFKQREIKSQFTERNAECMPQ